MSMYMPEQFANFMTSFEISSAVGAEDGISDVVEKVMGRSSMHG